MDLVKRTRLWDDKQIKFGPRDVVWIAGVLLLGAIGYLADAGMTFALMLLPLFSWLFAGCLITIFGIAIYQVFSGRTNHRVAGLFFGLFPLLCPLLGWSGWKLFCFLTT